MYEIMKGLNTLDVTEELRLLLSENNNMAYQALERLRTQSEKDASVYWHFDELAALLEHGNSYVRTRGIVLIADNIQWDSQGRFEELAAEYKDITGVDVAAFIMSSR